MAGAISSSLARSIAMNICRSFTAPPISESHPTPNRSLITTRQSRSEALALAFGSSQQLWLDALRFDDGATLKEISHGKGRIFWTAYPIELNEDSRAAAELYAYITNRLNIAPSFTQQSQLSPGVLVFPAVLADSMLYVFISDSASDTAINLRDQATGAPIAFPLAAEHAAIAVIGKKEKKVVAKYGF